MNCFSIRKATETLFEGGVIAYPTEAVFGLGCDPLNEHALQKILRLKHRPAHKGLILVASEFEQLTPFVQDIETQVFDRIMQTWPGPTTWLLPASQRTSHLLRGDSELQAVRMSNHPVVRALCDAFGGAIVSTSANTSKRPAARKALSIRSWFGDTVDYVVQANVGELKRPSEIRNAITGEVIRPG